MTYLRRKRNVAVANNLYVFPLSYVLGFFWKTRHRSRSLWLHRDESDDILRFLSNIGTQRTSNVVNCCGPWISPMRNLNLPSLKLGPSFFAAEDARVGGEAISMCLTS